MGIIIRAETSSSDALLAETGTSSNERQDTALDGLSDPVLVLLCEFLHMA